MVSLQLVTTLHEIEVVICYILQITSQYLFLYLQSLMEKVREAACVAQMGYGLDAD